MAQSKPGGARPGAAAETLDISDENNSESGTSPSSVSAATHDTSRSRYHVKDLASFAKNVEEAAARAFPNRGRSRYAEVIVVLMKWEEDDLNVEPEVDRLRLMFECYGFTTETWLIPSTNSHLRLMGMCVNFVEEYGIRDNLLIVYYGGHASINKSRQSTWSCKQDISYASVRWSAIQSVFEESRSDVLFLLDCCAAAGAAPDGGQGIIETIAACGFETWAPGPGRLSFTNALLSVLDDWMTRPSFSAAMLHSEVLSVIKHEKPERRRWADVRKVEQRKTPIYILTSNNAKSMSIELSRRITKRPEGPSPIAPLPTLIGDLNAADLQGVDIYDPETLNETILPGELKVPHILISVALEENQVLDLESWHRWFQQFPALAKYALVEGIFKGHSTVLLVSLPLPVWDTLSDDLAVSFVAYVESRNLLAVDSHQEYQTTSGAKPQAEEQDIERKPGQKTSNLETPVPFANKIETNFRNERYWKELRKPPKVLDPQIEELKLEIRYTREEAARAWEELGRREQEERQRMAEIRDGKAVLIGGIEVIPLSRATQLGQKQELGLKSPRQIMMERAAYEGGHDESPNIMLSSKFSSLDQLGKRQSMDSIPEQVEHESKSPDPEFRRRRRSPGSNASSGGPSRPDSPLFVPLRQPNSWDEESALVVEFPSRVAPREHLVDFRSTQSQDTKHITRRTSSGSLVRDMRGKATY